MFNFVANSIRGCTETQLRVLPASEPYKVVIMMHILLI